jgi:hypothetical protein
MDLENANSIQKILKEAQGNRTDIYLTLFREYVKPSDTPWMVLKSIVEYQDPVGTNDGSPSQIDPNEYQNTIRIYHKLLHETVRVIAQKNMPEDDFYICLYQNIFESKLFPEDDEVHAVFLEVLSEEIPELPYIQMQNLLKMGDEDFREITAKVTPQLNKAVYVLNRHLGSKTEETSQLWEIAQSLDGRNQQIVYWALIISLIRTSIDRATKQQPKA